MFTLEDLEVALNRPILPAEEGYYQYLVDAVTAYIESETGVAFSIHTNEVVRYRADGRGIIELFGPVVEVSEIAPVETDPYGSGWYYLPVFDGLAEVYGLCPYGVVDITYTYGYGPTEVPADIKHAAIEAVVGRIEADNQTGDLEEKTVGDITYRFRPFGELDFSTFGSSALDAYRGVARSWRL